MIKEEVFERDKHTSLLRDRIDYFIKCFVIFKVISKVASIS
jgi:hypothetical protein